MLTARQPFGLMVEKIVSEHAQGKCSLLHKSSLLVLYTTKENGQARRKKPQHLLYFIKIAETKISRKKLHKRILKSLSFYIVKIFMTES